MNKQQFLAEIEQDITEVINIFADAEEYYGGRLIDIMDTINAQLPTWISVDERLPEEGVTVNVLYNGDQVDVGAVYTHVPTWDEISTVPYKYWDHPINDGQDWAHDLITHWTPILELP